MGRGCLPPAHFDLIIIDESHRSIFKKYRAIFEYFDAVIVGLTATPKIDVDRNTYDFFEMEQGVPTYAYDYETVVSRDHVLVPYYNYEVKTKFLEEGIAYDELSEEDRERYEEDFTEDGAAPDFIPSAQLNKFVFNETTVDIVLQDLMERGIRVEGGERLGKTIIFDYCGNFEYFREHKEGNESRDTKSLSENIFGKQIKLAVLLQEAAYTGEGFQAWRQELVNVCHKQITLLNTDLTAVHLRLQHVEKYKDKDAFMHICETDEVELAEQIAPFVHLDDTDVNAKRFDNFMYGLMLAHTGQMPGFKHAKKQLYDMAAMLERRTGILQVKACLPMIREIKTEAFWDADDILLFEKVRKKLRGLIKFLEEEGDGKKLIFTRLADPLISQAEGLQLENAYGFEDYRNKVNRYVNEHEDTLAIYRLTHNIPLSAGDYQELERVLTSELGSKEDYKRVFGDTPFGLLVRKIAKMDHDAAMQAFSDFINDESLNQRQIAFVNKIISHVEQNGYMENAAELQKPPFDKPVSFVKLFDAKTRTAIIETIQEVRENAVHIIA